MDQQVDYPGGYAALSAAVYKTIGEHLQPDDRCISEVIADSYGGDEKAYVLAMARYYGLIGSVTAAA